MFKKIFRAIYYVLLGGLTIVALLLVFSAFPIAGNYKVMVVQSGSMVPAIQTGSAILIKGASTYRTGDVVTFKGTDKTPTTHRIVEETQEGYVTRGDANNANDLQKTSSQNILGKVFFSIPYLGYLLAWVKTAPGLIAMIVIPAVIIIFSEALAIQKEIKKIIQQRREKKVLEPVKVSAAAMPMPKVKKEFVSPLPMKSSKAKTIKETAKKTLKASAIIFGFLSLLNLREIQGTRAFFTDEEKGSAEMTAWVGETVEPGDVLINEVMWMGSRDNDGTDHTADEWIELKNTTDKDIDISNWRIDGAVAGGSGHLEIPANHTITANGYFLIANKNKEDSAINVDVDLRDTAINLNDGYNDNGALVLKDQNGNMIDSTPTPTDANWPAGTNTTDKKQSMERDTKGQTWHTCDITSMTTTEVSTMQSYWDSNAQNYNCGTPKHDNLSLNDFSVVNEPQQKINLQISDSTPTSTEGATSDLNPASNAIIGDSTPATENNIITDPGDSAPETDTPEGEEQKDIPPALEPNENQGDNDSAENPGETEDISPPSGSDDSQTDLAQEDPATDNTPPAANEEGVNNTDSSLSPPENPEPEISSPETSTEETPPSPDNSSPPSENLNNS